jgi:hypothetical protein
MISFNLALTKVIAIGGSIGTGLFLASGSTIANAGPGGALLAYSPNGTTNGDHIQMTSPKLTLEFFRSMCFAHGDSLHSS